MTRAFIFFWLLALCGFSGRAQEEDTALSHRLGQWKSYTAHHDPTTIFVCTDKSIYVPNSYLLFTGYLFKADHDTTPHHTLYVTLANPVTRRVVASDRFVLKDIVSSGSLFLSDTLAPGPYILSAYTNVFLEGKVQTPFRRVIYIRSGEEPAFPVRIAAFASPDSLRWTCRVTTRYGGLASGGTFAYRLSSPDSVLQTGQKRVDAFGEVHLALPLSDTSLRQLELAARVRRDTLQSDSWLPVPVRRQSWSIQYFPEGGNLVRGHGTRIGIELQNPSGRGERAQGVLLEDGTPIGVFNTDDHGWGMVACLPDTGKQYTALLNDVPEGTTLSGAFPPVAPTGYSLSVPVGVVRDTLTLRIQAPREGATCLLMVYSAQDILYASTLRFHASSGQIQIPIDTLVKGLATVTLLDEKGRPVAERTVYFPGQPLNVQVRTDSAEYHTDSKMTVHIKVTDPEGRGIESVFSLASVLNSRTKPATDPDITADSAIETALLTRYYSHYKWDQVIANNFSYPPVTHPADYGYVLYRNKPVTRPIDLLLVGSGTVGYKPFRTDSGGRFTLPANLLVAPETGHIILSVVEKKNQEEYSLNLLNEYDSVNRALAREWFYPFVQDPDEVQPEPVNNDKEFNAIRTLKTIVIKAGDDDHYYGDATCNDYVCPYNVLNCPNHPYGHRPVVGQTYMYFEGYGGPPSRIVYKGCVSPKVASPFLNEIHPIHLDRSLYKPDDKGSNAPGLETLVNSTLFWAPLTVTDKNGEQTVGFYTQELPGRFFIQVQGLSGLGGISGKTAFRIEDDR